MFYDIVSSLSFSPAAASQLTFYWRRLKKEQLTRQLSVVMAVGLVGLQIATIVAPPDPATASSPNDIIGPASGYSGGIDTAHPQATLIHIYATNPEIKALFLHYGINKDDLEHTVHGTLNSSNHKLLSLGRQPHSALDKKQVIGGHTYYLRPLYTWGDNVTYKALEGKRHGDNKYFAVLYNCGNLVLVDTTPSVPAPKPPKQPTPPKTPTPKTPTPAPTPTTTNTVTTTETPPPTTITDPPPPPPPGSPNISLAKSAILVSVADGSKKDANNAVAKPGDTIEYTLTTSNSGGSDAKNYVVTESIADVLEYADLVDARGGKLTGTDISWPKNTVKAGGSFITTFVVKVKNPIPVRPASVSDPESFDLKLDNFYGNAVRVNLTTPPEKQVEVASKNLPQTGTGEDVAIVLLAAAIISYFYFRNRQLVTELSILRNDTHGGV